MRVFGKPQLTFFFSAEKDPKTAKQLAAGKFPSHLTAPGTFVKAGEGVNCLANGEPYAEAFKYGELYKDKKKTGFLSSDFPKRDEFSNTMRTEQLREVLKVKIFFWVTSEQFQLLSLFQKERQAISDGIDDEEEDGTQQVSSGRDKNKSYLYDVVTRQVPTSFKFHRDDRQGKFFYMKERKEGKVSTIKKTNIDQPTWVNVTAGGRLLTVLVDTSGNVVAQQAGVTDLRPTTSS